jgi:hypothetical protein
VEAGVDADAAAMATALESAAVATEEGRTPWNPGVWPNPDDLKHTADFVRWFLEFLRKGGSIFSYDPG